jgi:DNA-binding MarR family transcriptional regulator
MVDLRPQQTQDGNNDITLGLLGAIQQDNGVTQRSLARDLGIALGLANTYLKRCVNKGLVKVSEIPSRRYAYYLTPHGFREKSKLTAEYLSQSFLFFRLARSQCSELFAECAERGWRHVVLVGASDLGEIATLCAGEHGVVVTAFIETGANCATFAGIPVLPDLAIVAEADAVIITELRDPQAAYDALLRIKPRGRVLHPSILRIADGSDDTEGGAP